MNFQRSSGILLHPSSLPSKFGIGDFGPNAYKFVDFLEKSGQHLWQILPLGPTSFGDSPYQSFSTFAGNTLFISPEVLCQKGYLEERDVELAPIFSCKKTDYGNAIPFKRGLFEKAHRRFQKKAFTADQVAFQKFCEKNSFWLEDYALFASLKDYFIAERQEAGFSNEFFAFEEKTAKKLSKNLQKDYYFGAVWSTWPEELVNREYGALEKWKRKLTTAIDRYKFLQFEFFSQWEALKQYANEKNIKIIGDVPIFVAYDSADTWANPKNYYIDEKGFPTVVAGVPPDYFSETGQLWGNPLYRWEEHEKTGYKWWIDRIRCTLNMVDILRIDHFRGFESYWAVPFGDRDATKGEWRKGPAEKLFKAVEKELGNLPIIAEDLGIITDDVRELRKKLGFPGMRILHFAFNDDSKNDYLPHNYEPNTVVYTGTHDNDTTIGWYTNGTEHEKDYVRRYMNISGDDIAWDMIRLAMSSSAVFAIFPIQDMLRLDGSHRMNIPSTSNSNWQFRFELSQLNEDDANGLRYLSELFNRIPEIKETVEQKDVSEEIEEEVVAVNKKEKSIKRPKRRR
ncbi:MAG: 4-alpha-glucanotransferase [Firmicutes bacterium]|nr:4-alpha-glucanotransferase [Bacillota bacterium]